ncbi:MAG: hypothetical protein PVG35_22875 [Desulfobacterales bacterium]|jgi:hypothetical protein
MVSGEHPGYLDYRVLKVGSKDIEPEEMEIDIYLSAHGLGHL